MTDLTYKQMCEAIAAAKILKRPDGSWPTAKEVWRYSPSGELFMLSVWFEMAMLINPTYFDGRDLAAERLAEADTEEWC